MTDGYNIGDIVRVAFGQPLDALAKADIKSDAPAIEQVEEQVRAPTSNELAEIEKLATDAARLQDEIQAAVGEKGGELRNLKSQLKTKLLLHGMKEVVIAGRPPIELTESRSRKPTRKAIVATMQKEMIAKLGDEKKGNTEGKRLALNLWNKLDPTVSQSISIPKPTPIEGESNY